MLAQQHRHAFVNAPREVIGGRDNQRGAQNRLTRLQVCTLIP